MAFIIHAEDIQHSAGNRRWHLRKKPLKMRDRPEHNRCKSIATRFFSQVEPPPRFIRKLKEPPLNNIVTNSNDSVTLRLMTEHDLAMLYEWLNRSHIVEWWGGEEARPTLADVQEQYLPSVLAQESVTPYIAMLNGEPIGYAQSYVALGSGDGWWEEETDPGVRGIDQLLANASQLGKGLGTKLVRALVELLFNDPEVTKIQTDPSPSNLRAIRCYEKAGFERQGTVTTPDGPAVYMVQTRQAFERTRSDA